MSVKLEDLQKHIKKESILHILQEDGSLKEITATIQAATVAGVVFKEKGRSTIELTEADKIEEITAAPVKPRPVQQKKLKPIEFGQARQHLIDRHGVQLSWAKDADEQAALDYHAGLDHTDLGHVHVSDNETKTETPAAAAEAPVENAG